MKDRSPKIRIDKTALKKKLRHFREIPVLMYHHVLKDAPKFSKFNLYVTQAEIEKQLAFLRTTGRESVTFRDLVERKIPKKPVILTFDDGYSNNYLFLFPLLKRYKMKAVIFILGNRKHKSNFWDVGEGESDHRLLDPFQIQEMAESGLVEFGSHSMNHPNLLTLSPKRLEHEISGSKVSLEKLLKGPVLSFAYPYGYFNDAIKKTVFKAGYTFGISTQYNGPLYFKEDLLAIRRVPAHPKMSLFEYFKKTSGYFFRYKIFLQRFKPSKKNKPVPALF